MFWACDRVIRPVALNSDIEVDASAWIWGWVDGVNGDKNMPSVNAVIITARAEYLTALFVIILDSFFKWVLLLDTLKVPK